MAVEHDLNTFQKCKHSLFAINVVAMVMILRVLYCLAYTRNSFKVISQQGLQVAMFKSYLSCNIQSSIPTIPV